MDAAFTRRGPGGAPPRGTGCRVHRGGALRDLTIFIIYRLVVLCFYVIYLCMFDIAFFFIQVARVPTK